MSQSIRIAISGGGLAGATLLYALVQQPHLDVHIFESASVFKEAGAAIGINCNAQRAMELILATKCLRSAGAVPQKPAQATMGVGENQGSIVCCTDAKSGSPARSIVHRASLLRELLANVPSERLHASKKLESVHHNSDGSLTIQFSDESTHNCDVLIGADGIHSTVRKLILGESEPAAVLPRNSGYWAIMALRPYAEAQASIGKEIDIDDPREHAWIGNGTFLMHNILSEGQLVQLILAAYEEEAVGSDRWRRTVPADEIRRLYQDWPEHLRKGIEQLLCDEPEKPALYLWEHLPSHTYTSGQLCIIGDAAHATTPWQASGGGMSIEDSFLLSSLLSHAKSIKEAVNALEAYNKVQRPRTQSIIESSRITGEIMTGRNGETEMPLDQIRERLAHRWDFIHGIDLEKHRDEAISIMERLNLSQ